MSEVGKVVRDGNGTMDIGKVDGVDPASAASGPGRANMDIRRADTGVRKADMGLLAAPAHTGGAAHAPQTGTVVVGASVLPAHVASAAREAANGCSATVTTQNSSTGVPNVGIKKSNISLGC